MLAFQEKVLLDGILLEIVLHDDFRYRLRYGDLVDRVAFYAPYQTDPERWRQVLAGFKE